MRQAIAHSYKDVFRWIPLFVWDKWTKPARIALDAYNAVKTSVIAKPSLYGYDWLPVRCMKPVYACIMLSNAGKFILLPISPYPDTEQYIIF